MTVEHMSSFNRDSSFEEVLNAACKAERSLDNFMHNSGMRAIYESEPSEVGSEHFSVRSDTFDSDFDSLTSELDHLIEREDELRRELEMAEECCQHILDEGSDYEDDEIAGTDDESYQGGDEAAAIREYKREHKREFADLLNHWRHAEETHTLPRVQGTMEDDSRWIITYSEANPKDEYSVRKGVTAGRLRKSLSPRSEAEQAEDENSSRYSESFATVSEGGMESEAEDSFKETKSQQTESILDLISPEVFRKLSTADKIAALEKAISLENVVALESIEALLAEALGKIGEEKQDPNDSDSPNMNTKAVPAKVSEPKTIERSPIRKGRSYYLPGTAKDDGSKLGSVPSVLMLSLMSDEPSLADGSPYSRKMPISELLWSITVSVAELLYGERPDSIESAVVSKLAATLVRRDAASQQLTTLPTKSY